jgi:hypothetical protein
MLSTLFIVIIGFHGPHFRTRQFSGKRLASSLSAGARCMKKTLIPAWPLYAVWLLCLCLGNPRAEDLFDSANPQLEDAIFLRDVTLPDRNAKETIHFAALPAKAGKTIVLRFQMVSYAPKPAGCNFNARVTLNNSTLGRHTAAGTERMLGRAATFTFRKGNPQEFPVFAGENLMTLFAPDMPTGNGMTTDDLGATFIFDISDLARGVDGNTLTFQNIRGVSALGKRYDLMARTIEVGWLDNAKLPAVESRVPERGAIAHMVSEKGLQLSQGEAGGFSLRTDSGLELRVETALSMSSDTPSELAAQDAPIAESKVHAEFEAFGSRGFRMKARWPELQLVRTIELLGGLLTWKERWTNTGTATLGVPFRHRLFMPGDAPRFRLAGNPDAGALASSPANPTIFAASTAQPGNGMGITAESDWLRLLMALRESGGLVEIYSNTLALAPGASVDFDFTVDPITEGGGYWSFINNVRERWGINASTAPAPIFWGAATGEGPTPEERTRNSFGHLGPIVVALGPWVRLSFDRAEVMRNRYPTLPEGAPRSVGKCPDLDVEKWLTFKHRDAHWKQYADEVELIHRTCPKVKVIQLMHPSMEIVYRPLAHRWPYADCGILRADGTVFEEPYYSRAHLSDWVNKDWGVWYYVPRAGSEYLKALLRDVRVSMDVAGCDGIYFDEFSFAGTTRGYSRYDYGQWDGYSADLDDQGNVVRLKSDNGRASEPAQLQIISEVIQREKLFLGNGSAALRSVNEQPVLRFTEGGNGHGKMAGAHLNTVPLILGNFGDSASRKGVFEAVKSCLSTGCVYSPVGVNLLLEGPDNFVCKLYPITIRRLGEGTVVGEERLITMKSGAFDWPGNGENLTLYVYDANGDRVKDRVSANLENDVLTLHVPQGGLAIAERTF